MSLFEFIDMKLKLQEALHTKVDIVQYDKIKPSLKLYSPRRYFKRMKKIALPHLEDILLYKLLVSSYDNGAGFPKLCLVFTWTSFHSS